MEIKPNTFYINKKHQNKYKVLLVNIINCTNENDGQKMVIYTNGEKLFAREEKEFFEKFEVANE